MINLLSMIDDAVERVFDGKYFDLAQAREFLRQVSLTPETLTDAQGNSIPFRPEDSPDNEHYQYFRGLDINRDLTQVVGTLYTQKRTPTTYEKISEECPQPIVHNHPRERHRIRTRLQD